MANMTPATPKKRTLTETFAILDKATENINKKCGKIVCGRIGKIPEIAEKLKIKWLPSPSYTFNELTGGGIPIGKFTIIAGEADSGKTSSMLELIAYNMRKNPEFIACWLESENSITKEYAVDMFGIDPERFFYIEHEKNGAAETAIDILNAVVTSGCIDICVVNSLKCLIPKTEMEQVMEKDTVALQARMNSKIIKKFTAVIQECDTAFVAITHLTANIGSYYEPLVMSGGRAIRYASMLTLYFQKCAVLENDPIKPQEGMKLRIKVKKNHCCCDRYPYQTGEYFIRYGEGVAWELELLKACIAKGIVTQKGAWLKELPESPYYAESEKRHFVHQWQGRSAFKAYLLEHEDYRQYLEEIISMNATLETLSSQEVDDIAAEDMLDAEAYNENVLEPQKKNH